ncbi:DUF6969 family protein [Rhodanobacter thiooxydans]|uniref:DUF6969 family protein n=1 Tax=Rhodanobacter thiooxydans TaxID=416169 RepID=UPI000260C933|nr:hypothetical protein [Rhodanobacter thiooxydans]EIL96891.1 hypothetical protein UUA_16633 [Rhodanobacter thiooxydans LCS2]MCW0201115.1 hypothetical protein [Rhodanobacter thiooxydans]
MTTSVRTDRAHLRVSRSALQSGLLAGGAPRLRSTRRTARDLISLLDDCVARGVTPLGEALGPKVPQAWQQYAAAEGQALRAGGWFFYYHSHDRGTPGEHGHFHVFTDLPRVRGKRVSGFSHLVGIGVDARGLPLRLFTTNRWVTAETWQDAQAMTAKFARLVAARPDASDRLERWLHDLLVLFAPQIRLLLARRDRRVAAHGGEGVFEDRRMYVLSCCKVSLTDQVAAIDAASS